jgi:hypothetical protein
MKIILDNEDVAVIERNAGVILMDRSRRIFIIKSYTIEEKEEPQRIFFIKTGRTIKTKYLVYAEINTYRHQVSFYLDNDESRSFLVIHDLDIMRQNWLDFNEELRMFDLKVIENKRI